MKYFANLLVLLFSLSIFSSSFAEIYDDWPDDAICTWLEQKPDHKGYLAENEKRVLNCFERKDFSPRNDFDFFEPKKQIYM
ncbi:MAG: hypothetical protein HOH71_04655 [Gammaproteobacteria bacterium]|jgi:hypothetical protein|nr:hypothetical protein [Gammaproteobacteria bacterium]